MILPKREATSKTNERRIYFKTHNFFLSPNLYLLALLKSYKKRNCWKAIFQNFFFQQVNYPIVGVILPDKLWTKSGHLALSKNILEK